MLTRVTSPRGAETIFFKYFFGFFGFGGPLFEYRRLTEGWRSTHRGAKREFVIDFLLFFGVAVIKSAASAASPGGLQAEKLDF